MKAINLLSQLCSECLSLESCYVWDANINSGVSIEEYFGKSLRWGEISEDKNYFAYYGDFDEHFMALVAPTACLSGGSDSSVVFLWELE